MEPTKPTGPVMDIQKPQGGASPQPSGQPQPTIITPSSSLGRPATMEYTRPRPQDPGAPNFSPKPTEEMQQKAADNMPKPKKSKKGLVIGLVAFFIVAAGAGAAYYFLVMQKDTPAPVVETQTTTTESTQTADAQATPEGVDDVTNSIDKSLNTLDDTADYNSNDVSSNTLGV